MTDTRLCKPTHPFGVHTTHRFLQRYNKVVLDVAAVDKERGRLEQENADLRQLLKTFLDGIRCGTAGLVVHASGGLQRQCMRRRSCPTAPAH
jgi:hypothetical protein